MGGRDELPEPVTSASARAIGALVALSISAFCYVAVETLPIGILSLIATDLNVSLSHTGLLVTGYAVTVAVVSVPLTYLTQRVPRRRLLIVLLGVLVVATVGSAAARDYQVLLWARVVVALTQALFWAVVAPAAAGMFPLRVRGKVTAVVFAGASLGPMLGVPAGTWLGQQLGWRAAFLALAGVALAAFVAIVTLMPSTPMMAAHAFTGTSPDARRYATVVVATALSVGGLFTAFTYTAVFLTDVTGFAPAAVGLLLLIRGLADFAGIAVGGIASDRNQRVAMVAPVLLLAIALLAMFVLADSPLATGALLALTGFALGALTPALQNRVLEVAPGRSDLAAAGNSAAFNVGIAGGSLLGAVLLPGFGVRSTALAGGLLAVAALLVLLAEPLVASPGRSVERRPADAAQPGSSGTGPAVTSAARVRGWSPSLCPRTRARRRSGIWSGVQTCRSP
ncbi:MFS transporter [Micromonospora andamanensis]|uniref:Chloramphenicol resistance protein n=1 Tax=Micromonospora andamanensis TaxID=1287068 RepID=A0ABQ4HZK8_9ACTN|nr:MFS transporter [Micromonospora andamanensis]GIJ11062.1 chloramphenicol resistance protein [Micromonospora andamanensis]